MKKIILSLFAILLILLGCGDTTQDVTMPGTTSPTGTVQGFVRDYKTNAAIEDVTVTLYAAGTKTTTTDDEGYWYLTGVPAQPTAGAAGQILYTLTAPVADADYLPMSGVVTLSTVAGGQNNALATVNDWMVKTATVSGFVTDSATGSGINGATVVILDFIAVVTWAPGLSNAAVDSQALTATTAARTEGGDGYYSFTTVPALTIALANLGAYATGYEYATAAGVGDGSALTLQYAASAIVDFQLNPLDNALGLVVASVTTATGTTTNMLIMVDATGTATTGAVPKVDMDGATQLVFNLIFDQAIDTTSFYGDTILLADNTPTTILANLTPVWTTGNYALTLTGQIDIFDDALANPYQLRTSPTRIIYAAGGGEPTTPTGQIAANTQLAQFFAYDSSTTASSPTPLLYLTDMDEDDDTAIEANDGVVCYDASEVAYGTTAFNYTGSWETYIKNKYTRNVNAYNNAIDIYWADTAPNETEISAYSVYYQVTTSGGDVLVNWTGVVNPTVREHDDFVIVEDLAIAAGLDVNNNLRYGEKINIALTVMDTLGVETAIPAGSSQWLILSDSESPEIALFASGYADAAIMFSEEMGTTTTTTVTPSNANIVSLSPAWAEQPNTNVGTQLKLYPSGTATATVKLAGDDSITAGGLITFNSENEANLFYIGQAVRLTYTQDNTVQDTLTVANLNTTTAAPTVTLSGAPTGDITDNVFVSVLPTNTQVFRSGWSDAATAANISATQITLTVARNVAIGDTLLLRETATNTVADAQATVSDVNGAVLTITISSGTYDALHDNVYFLGDVLTVVATDEAGNSMHADADQVCEDANTIYPLVLGTAAENIF